MPPPATALCRDCLWTGETAPRRCPSCGSPRIVGHAELASLTMAHLDCDAFYASVEKRDRPELRDKPVIVGGGKRGVVTTACYIARLSGPRSAMPMYKALKLCPDAVVIKPDFAKYKAASKAIFDKVRDLTPLVQQLSLDEAWIDLSGTERLNGGSAAWQLARLQAEVEREVGITVSIGLSANKFLAKIASDLDKPRGFSVIGGAEAKAFLAGKPVGILPGVGPVFRQTLENDGYRTVGDLARAEPKELAERYGDYGLKLARLSRGQDVRAVNPDEDRKSVSAETTFNEDHADQATLEDELWPLCEKVAGRMRKEGLAGRAVVLKLKRTDFRSLTRRRTLAVPTQTAKALFQVGRELLAVETRSNIPYRLIGIGLSDLAPASDAIDLFAEDEARARKSERTLDELRAKFGQAAIVSGRSLKS